MISPEIIKLKEKLIGENSCPKCARYFQQLFDEIDRLDKIQECIKIYDCTDDINEIRKPNPNIVAPKYDTVTEGFIP